MKKSSKIKLLFAALMMNFVFHSALVKADSTKMAPVAATPNTILMIDSGYIDDPGNDGTWPLVDIYGSNFKYFQTSRVCPANFTPYVTVEVTRPGAPGTGSEVYKGGGACVWGVNKNANNYTVFFLPVRRTAFVSAPADAQLCNSGSDNLEDRNGRLLVGGGCYPGYLFMTTKGNYGSEFTASYVGAEYQTRSGIRGIEWKLYCYPPNNIPAGMVDYNYPPYIRFNSGMCNWNHFL